LALIEVRKLEGINEARFRFSQQVLDVEVDIKQDRQDQLAIGSELGVYNLQLCCIAGVVDGVLAADLPSELAQIEQEVFVVLVPEIDVVQLTAVSHVDVERGVSV